MNNDLKNNYHNLQGEQKDQLLVVCDKNGNKIGTATREECHKGMGKTHLAFLAFVLDKEGKIILTRRSKNKSLWPLFWDASVVSHVLPEENAEQSAKRRGKEELGIEIDFHIIGSFYYYADQEDRSENEYCYVLIGESEADIYPNPIEIEEVKKVSYEELCREVKNHSDVYTPWIRLALEKIEIKNV